MSSIPTLVPACISAGDSVSWQRTFVDYPSNGGWTLKYTAVPISGSGLFSFQATGQSDGSYLVTLLASTTHAWTAGKYTLAEYVDNGTQRITLFRSTLVIAPNLAGASGAIDTRSHARKMLDSINAYMEARTPTTMLIMIDGKRLEHYPLNEIIAMRDRYRAEVSREEQASSGNPPARLLVRL